MSAFSWKNGLIISDIEEDKEEIEIIIKKKLLQKVTENQNK